MSIDTIVTGGVSTTKNKLPSSIEIYRALTAIPSISATEEALDQSNADLVTLSTNWFRNLGFSVEMQPVPGTRNKFNTLASIGQGAGSSLLAGHVDMVLFDNDRWACDPFMLAEYDGKLYGLGTVDMKGSFALILDALHDVGVTKLKKLLYVLATAGEEASMAGACYFAKTIALYPDCATIGESTLLRPVRVHRGHISSAIRVQDQSGRSSDPTRGTDATELVYDAIGHTLQLHDNLKERYHYEAFIAPYPTLNLEHTHGGDISNHVCACCKLCMNIRLLPGMTLNELNGLFNDTLAPVSERQSGRLTVDELYPPIPGYEYPPDHQLVEVVEKLLGAKTEVMNYYTETPFIQTLCPTLALRPGSINQAHQPDEYLETRSIKPTRGLVIQAIHYFYWH